MGVARVVDVLVVVAALVGVAPSASADQILFSRQNRDGERLWVMRSDGSGARRLPNFGARDPDLSPDGRRLVWSGNDNSLRTGTITGEQQRVVWRVGVQSENPPFWARWSPSGGQIAAVRGTQVFVVRPGSRARKLRTSVSIAGRVSWSPDGRRIVAPVGAQDAKFTTLWVIDVASGAARELVRLDGEATGSPAWSPDGRWIAFTRSPSGDPPPSARQLWLVRPDGSGLHQLAQVAGGAGEPSWSPDGRRLAFETDLTMTRSNIATMRSDGSGLRLLTRGGRNLSPDWSR